MIKLYYKNIIMINHKLKRKIKKLDIIDENKLFLESQPKYNEYNQINVIDKLYEIYVSFIKFLFNYKN